VCPNAGLLGRAGWPARSAPTTFVYMQTLVIGWALGGTRARSYCHFARESSRCEAQHCNSMRRLVRRPATSHERTRVSAMSHCHMRWVLMLREAQTAVKLASELEIGPENTTIKKSLKHRHSQCPARPKESVTALRSTRRDLLIDTPRVSRRAEHSPPCTL
jgi:hypothetical protein